MYRSIFMAVLKKWSAFFNRTDLTTNDNFQVVGIDLSNATPANRNQRTPITQLLRAGKNLSDLTSPSAAVTALGATSASTPNALVQRNASGITAVTTLNVDGASAPAVNIGATASFNIGLATASNNFFNGTVNGDTCIRQGNTARQLLLGVGAGNAQFAVQNGGPQSNVSHKFAYAGTNRMPYLDASSILTGSANYTVNGTGGLTITQGFTAATGTFSGLGGVVIGGTSPSANIGSTTQYAATTGNNQFFNPSLTGDTCIRNTSTTNFIRIGVGGGNAQFIVGNTTAIFGVGFTLPTSGATAGSLDYYEQNVSFNLTMNTPDGTTHDLPLTVSRIGKIVTVEWDSLTVTANTATTFNSSITLPTKWRPVVAAGIMRFAPVTDNTAAAQGRMSIASSGVVTFGVGVSGGNFTASGQAIIQPGSVTYLTA